MATDERLTKVTEAVEKMEAQMELALKAGYTEEDFDENAMFTLAALRGVQALAEELKALKVELPATASK